MSSKQTSNGSNVSDGNKPEDKKEPPMDTQKAKGVESKKTESKVSQKDDSKTKTKSTTPVTPLSTQSSSASHQTINSLSDSQQSVITIESLRYLGTLDKYVKREYWDLDIEYNSNALSGLLWSLVITTFIYYEINAKCRQDLSSLIWLSTLVSTPTAIELALVWPIWWVWPLILSRINLSKLCLGVIVIHLVLGSLNLLVAVIQFGSYTCYQIRELDPNLEYNVPVRYDVKTTGLLHCIVAINLFLCAMLLAIKRNDFKYYVLWRKGMLNKYLLLGDD